MNNLYKNKVKKSFFYLFKSLEIINLWYNYKQGRNLYKHLLFFIMATIKAIAPAAKIETLNGEASKTPPVQPVQIPVIIAEKRESTVFTLEDKIFKIQMLGDLIDQREKLNESLKKLQAFKKKSDSFLDKITLRDSIGNEFSTSNCDALQKCLQVLKDAILTKLQVVEAQIIL